MDLLWLAAVGGGLLGVVLVADWVWSRHQKRRLDATGRVGGSHDPLTNEVLYDQMRDQGNSGTQ